MFQQKYGTFFFDTIAKLGYGIDSQQYNLAFATFVEISQQSDIVMKTVKKLYSIKVKSALV